MRAAPPLHPRLSRGGFPWGRAIFLLGLLLLGAGPLFPQIGFAQIGEVRVLKGVAVISRPLMEVRAEAGTRVALFNGDRIRTEDASKAHVVLVEGSGRAESIMTQNTDIRVAALSSRGASPLRLFFGAVRSRLVRYLGSAAFLSTPSATVGIKGTDFIIYAKRPEATEFIGIAGVVEGVSRTNAEHRLRIGKRQWGEIVAGVAPKPPIRVPDALWFPALREFSFPP